MELRTTARGSSLFLIRTLSAALTALFFFLGIYSAHQGFSDVFEFDVARRIAAQTFSKVLLLHVALIALLGPMLTIESIDRERREQTLGLLLLSRLRPVDLVAAKLFASTAILVMISSALLPIYALVAWLGGIDPDWLPALAVLGIVLSLLSCAVGLAAAALMHNATLAGMGSATVALLVLVVFFTDLKKATAGAWIASPAEAVRLVLEQNPGTFPGFAHLLGALLAGSFFFSLAALYALPRLKKLGRHRLREVLDAGIETSPEYVPATGNPVAWLAERSGQWNSHRLLRYGNALAVFALVLGMFVETLGGSGVLDRFKLLGLTALFLSPAIAVGANVWIREKRQRTFLVLLSTPLSARDILLGKFRAVLPAFLFLLIAFFMACVPTLVKQPHFDISFFFFLLWVVSLQILLFSLAMLFSLRLHNAFQTAFATLATIAVLFLFRSYFGNGSRMSAGDLIAPFLCAVAAQTILYFSFDSLTDRSA